MSILQKYQSIIIASLVIVLYAVYVYVTQFYVPPNHLKITMLNIGQGDAILIQIGVTHFQTIDMLVDAGPDHSVVYELGDVLPPWNKTLEYAIVSHEHADHVNGFFEFEGAYTVERWLFSDHTQDSDAARVFHDAMEQLGGQQQHVRRGDSIQLAPEAQLQILNPTNAVHDDLNEDSVVAWLQFTDFSFLLMGDAYRENEQEIMTQAAHDGRNLDVDVLKAGHHGSKTSTSPEWLEVTHPEIVLISAGVDNTFGHPHYRVIKDIQNSGATVFQTNRDGRIVCLSDGEDYECTPARSSAFQMLSALGLAPK